MAAFSAPSKTQAWWAHRQGLDGSLSGKSPAEILAQTGWARSVGGSSPYLTLFSRAGISRETADAAVADQSIHELPSARGCTYFVPKEHFALALKVSQGFADAAELKTAHKLGVTDAEIDRLGNGVVKALAKGPLDPDELKKHTDGLWRSLGPDGVKKGITTTLPVALGSLQTAGEIRRIPVSGRMDGQRYKYARWSKNPLADFKLSREEAFVELARLFLQWTGGASPAEFQWFSGLGVKAAIAALEPLRPVEWQEGRLQLAPDQKRWASFRVPAKPSYSLVGSIDGLFHLRRDLMGLQSSSDPIQAIAGLTDLPSHAIVDRGAIVGLWEYDPDAGAIAWTAFHGRSREMEAAVEATQAFIRDQLGDARAFSLDSPKSRAPRLAALRK